MEGTILRFRAWGISIAAHAALGIILALLLGAGHHHPPPASPALPMRLVWVEPAPPARGSPAALPAPVVPASGPAAPEPAVVPAPRAEVANPSPLTRNGSVRPPPPPSRPQRRAAARPAPALPDDAREAAPSPEVVAPSDGADHGVASGVTGGVTGGLGDAPLALAAVASPPELLERVVPEYPSRARALEVEGQVVLEVVLDRVGRPEPDIRVLRSVALLDAAAVAAVRQWRFRPARDAAGRPVRVVMEVPVRFLLR